MFDLTHWRLPERMRRDHVKKFIDLNSIHLFLRLMLLLVVAVCCRWLLPVLLDSLAYLLGQSIASIWKCFWIVWSRSRMLSFSVRNIIKHKLSLFLLKSKIIEIRWKRAAYNDNYSTKILFAFSTNFAHFSLFQMKF